MQILWDEEGGFVKDLLQQFPEPKAAYHTVSTIIRILEKKGFVDHRSFGKSHQYYPLVSREQYRNERFSGLMKSISTIPLNRYCPTLVKMHPWMKDADEII